MATHAERTARHPPTGPGLAYVPALDGLRGVAVAAVLLFHGGVSWLPGGWLGVDVFFVLSGYLITSLLLVEHGATGRVSLRRFWARRARRLLPAVVLLVAVVLLGAHWWAAEADTLHSLRIDALATLGYVANWRHVFAGHSYFNEGGAPSPLLHTWSLAVEEQFYLVWPLVAIVALRRSRRALGIVAAVGAVASSLLAAVLAHDVTRAYYGTDTRAQALLLGALLAVLLTGRTLKAPPSTVRPMAVAAAIGGLSVLVVLWLRLPGTSSFVFHGGLTLAALATVALLGGVLLAPGTAPDRMLSVAPLRAVGRVSYGLYLWHWPVFLALTGARTGLQGAPLLALRLAVTAAAAIASLVLVEDPVRFRTYPQPRPALAAVGAGLAAALVVAAVIQDAGTSSPAAAAPLAASAVSTAAPATTPTAAAANPAAPGSTTATSSAPATTARAARPPHAAGTPVKVLALGDSVGYTLAQNIAAPAKAAGVDVVNGAILGCGVVLGSPYRYFGAVKTDYPQCAQWTDLWTQSIAQANPDVVLVLVGRWEVMDRTHDGAWTHVGDPAFDDYVRQKLDTALTVAGRSGAAVAIATAPYYRRGERPDGGLFPEDDPARVDHYNQLLADVVAKHPEVHVIDLHTKLAPNGVYTAVVDGVKVRYDGVHIGPQGAKLLAPWLLPQLTALVS